MMKRFFVLVGLLSFYGDFAYGSAKSLALPSFSGSAKNQLKAVSLQNLLASPQVSAPKNLTQAASSVSGQGVYFRGMSEPTQTGYKNGFLCGAGGVGSASAAGKSFEAQDCHHNAISQAIGFDISQGDTLQFFNNFTYWLRKKSSREQNLKINHPGLRGIALDQRMVAEGWDTVAACCIVVTTNPVLQRVISPEVQAQDNEVKVIVQLWYNGEGMLQLWSQDVVLIPRGKGFVINISSQADKRGFFADDMQAIQLERESMVTTSAKKGKKGKTEEAKDVVDKGVDTYIATVRKFMQPKNRNKDAYDQSVDSPRMVRIAVVS